MNQELKNNSNLLILSHSFIAIAVSFLVYLYNTELAKAILLGSLTFNIYLRMLCHGFSSVTDIQASSKTTTSLFSALRALVIAIILSILIVKFKLNLIGLGVAFLLYQVIFIGVGIYINASHNRRAIRQDSQH